MFKNLFNYNKWQKIHAVNAKGKAYTKYACPKCQKETVAPTNHCAHCGKRLIRGGKMK